MKEQERLLDRLQDVLDTMPAYAILVTEDHKVIYANKFFKETFGQNEEDLPCYKYLFNKDVPCGNCQTFVPLKTGQPHTWEWIGPNGKEFEVHDYVFKDEKGKRVIMEMGIDMSEHFKMEEQLREMTSQMILAEENQRKIFATNLHDTVVQTLGVIKLRLQMFDHSDAEQNHKENYEAICNLTDQAIKESRLLMQELSPQVLYELGFVEAIEWLIDNAMNRDHGVDIEYQLRNPGVFTKLAKDIQILLFQSVRELLNNIVKHSEAKRAIVSLTGSRHDIKILVRDYGKGFKKTEKKIVNGGFGLMNINERLKYLKGQMNVKTGKSGTSIDIRVPIVSEQ